MLVVEADAVVAVEDKMNPRVAKANVNSSFIVNYFLQSINILYCLK